jgi:hypothetical protein
MANTTVTGAQAIHGQNPQVSIPLPFKVPHIAQHHLVFGRDRDPEPYL